ncbi:TlpA family protein disulfide reductase [Winogradskyella immobilis]|uniref:TlpA family protein disulfide reductase n=1 Tax=Winogradskyella immobilis TaxID=2816852 RepID=A0ABS8EKQ0_9FLAO|nr:TlpA disulfide reductase family protein [Winogradskyella immobilis]MCC1483733.1 TlpA family protein disulfide reductase [Winogradskyella immobilis]MCG0015827.1 TlpA family protein disulfide reductase [Winogradskyella immobilis]
MKTNLFIILLCISICLSCKSEKEETKPKTLTTVLVGEVINRPESDTLLLVKSYEDARFDIIANIPIVDNEFYHEFESKEIEAYDLIFKEEHDDGAWRTVRIFPETDTIHLTLYSQEDFNNNKVVGGKLNNNYTKYLNTVFWPYIKKQEEVYKIFDSIPYENTYSDVYAKVIEKLNRAETQEEQVPIYAEMKKLQEADLDKNEFGKKVAFQAKTSEREYFNRKYTFIRNNPSIVSYSLIIEDIQSIEYNGAPKEKIIEALNRLKEAFPEHTYTELAENLWIGYTEMKPGGQYVNFKAPDVKNVLYELKPEVDKNEIVLLDLWATWCGPCIAKTRLVRPVYDKYKEKGFSIVGVAGEFENLDRYNIFMTKEKWPWLNLIELDKQNKIWEKYNVMNGGGGMFLISGSGEILAVDPTAEEVESILQEKLVSNTVKL